MADPPPGSCHVKQFRSAAEFAPHAAWLLTDPALNPSNCECLYCSKKPNPMGRKHRPPFPQGPSPTTGVHRHPSSISLRTKHVKRTASSLTQDSSHSTGRSSLEIYIRKVKFSQDREAQDRPAPPGGVNPLYRIQELVWILEQPVSINLREGDLSVRLWPGVVETVDVPPPSTADTVEHGLYYQVKILSLDRRYSVPQGFLSPFQAHLVDETTPQTHRCDYPEIDLNCFDPFPQWLVSPCQHLEGGNQPESNPEFLAALLLLDIKAARLIASCWGATRSITRLLTVSGAVTGDDHREQKITPLPSGTPPASPSTTQPISYGGLWWGAEHVQAGDLLRLSFSESRFTYTGGASACLAHEPPVKGASSNIVGGSEVRSERCMFLGLRDLIVVHEQRGKALHAVGQLYKLVQAPPSIDSKPSVIHGDTELPQPPEGHVFHRVLVRGWEVQLPLRLVRGRYYPRLKSHLCDPTSLNAGLLGSMEGLTTVGSFTPRYNVTESRGETIERAKRQMF